MVVTLARHRRHKSSSFGPSSRLHLILEPHQMREGERDEVRGGRREGWSRWWGSVGGERAVRWVFFSLSLIDQEQGDSTYLVESVGSAYGVNIRSTGITRFWFCSQLNTRMDATDCVPPYFQTKHTLRPQRFWCSPTTLFFLFWKKNPHILNLK